MKSALICLQEKKDAFDKMKKNYEDTVAYIQVILGGNSSMIHVYIEVMQPISRAMFMFLFSGPSSICGEANPRGV